MFIYISLGIGSFLVGISGIVIIIFSIISAVGLTCFMGLSKINIWFNNYIGMTMISSEVAPFLILAIGTDNMFIIYNSYKR